MEKNIKSILIFGILTLSITVNNYYFVHSLDSSSLPVQLSPDQEFPFLPGSRGVPGVDFPLFGNVPETQFSCENVDEDGYYADLETNCQAFHICEDGKKISFLCPNGTIFQQSSLTCEWWFNVDCTNAPNLYSESAEQLREQIVQRKASRRVYTETLPKNHKASSSINTFDYDSVKKNEEKVSVPEKMQKKKPDEYVSISVVSNVAKKQQSSSISNRNTPNKGQNKKPVLRKTLRLSANLFAGSNTPSRRTKLPLKSSENIVIYGRQSNDSKLSDSGEESQITQETGSFFRNSFQALKEDQNKNIYANHRDTYFSDSKPMQTYTTKRILALSSVTPHYLTTVPINNGKPFIGIQIGAKLPTSTPSMLQENAIYDDVMVNQVYGKYSQNNRESITPITTTITPLSSTIKAKLTPTTSKTKISSSFSVTKKVTDETPEKVVKPRPFRKDSSNGRKPDIVESTTLGNYEKSTASNFPLYRISSASPFMVTEKTQNNTLGQTSVLPKEPPSVGPILLHTFAEYIANNLDTSTVYETPEIDEEAASNFDGDANKRRLTELLTEMTRHGYGSLFLDQLKTTEDTLPMMDIQYIEDGKNTVESDEKKRRELAQLFTKALSSFFEDPAKLREALEMLRPTEPPELHSTTTTTTTPNTITNNLVDEELLNFSDSAGYQDKIETLKDVNSDHLVPLYINNKRNKEKMVTNAPALNDDDLPTGHWTTSPKATKLWTTAFSFDPALINDNFLTTTTSKNSAFKEDTDDFESTISVEVPTIPNTEYREIEYELRSLPRLNLNSSAKLHGILIDFMNKTKSNDNVKSREMLNRILTKLNTTQEDFVIKMREIESNPLTRRLVLLLISECAKDLTKNSDNSEEAKPIQERDNFHITEESGVGIDIPKKGVFRIVADEIEDDVNNEDTRGDVEIGDGEDAKAYRLLNSLYSIASKFGR